ncbi:MAG TPA: UvrD-helicase domain-containing protein, partial [Opitutaceae bacterium]
MPEIPSDNLARERFRTEHDLNFAVVASAGSGKTRAISERLAAIAVSPLLSPTLERTAVVTYTKKAAAQIAERARSELRRQLAGAGVGGAEPIIRLEKAFFGTIHSFCLLLARRHGSTLGVHLNPAVVDDDDEPSWQEFLAQDPMAFTGVSPSQLDGFLRHASLDIVFPLAMRMAGEQAASILGAAGPAEIPPAPAAAALDALAAASARKGRDTDTLSLNKSVVENWMRLFAQPGRDRLPIPRTEGNAAGAKKLYREVFAPLKAWLAAVGGRLAAELSVRYRQWRSDRGVQTFADQLETAHAVLSDEALLEAARRDGWRVILDEAQDTDTKQFDVLVEITRPPGAARGTWPGPGPAPRPGRFCMVGDPQQSIYSGRANIDRFIEHVDALGAAQGGDRLRFDVTFRAPTALAAFLNETLAPAFGASVPHNLAAPPAAGAPQRKLQVDYSPMVAFPANPEGLVRRIEVEPAGRWRAGDKSNLKLAAEARQVASLLKSGGPSAVGAANLGEICILAPRNEWLRVIRDEFERVGVKTSLQVRQIRSAQNPAYAWLCGLLAAICDPENAFEWAGVLREVFAVSDAEIAESFRALPLRWEEPDDYPPGTAAALRVVAPFIGRADDEGVSLAAFASDLAEACGLHGLARAADPDGNVSSELERLLAKASDLGALGSGPREWLADLLAGLDVRRSSGRPAAEAVNILTCHSAKGLEWPVVIAMGLWRQIGARPERGLRLSGESPGQTAFFLDEEGI